MAIYFAGGMYHPIVEQSRKIHGKKETYKVALTNAPVTFGMVHCTGDDRPYLTKNCKGLKLTSEHANLYVLSDDLKTAHISDYRCSAVGYVPEVFLTEEQIENVKKAIEDNYFFD